MRVRVVGQIVATVGLVFSGAGPVLAAPSWTSTSVPTARIAPADLNPADGFGISVALSADGRVLVVGATGDDSGGTDRGAIYVFNRPAGGWSTGSLPAAKLTNRFGANTDLLGISVAVSGDGGTIVAGANGDDTTASGAGAAIVYVRPDGGWVSSDTPTAKLTSAIGANAADQLGLSVSISGDGGTIVAGAAGDDTAGTNRGAAYLYLRPVTGWASTSTPSAKLTNSVGAANDDSLGFSVTVSSDGATVAAGAIGDGPGLTSDGAIAVYVKPASGWATTITPTARLKDGTTNGVGALGWSVSASADGSTILAGAPTEANGGTNRGAAAIFTRPAAGWETTSTPAAQLTSSPSTSFDVLGTSVAINADGGVATIGAYGDDTGGTSRGAAYVFVRPAGGWTATTDPAAKLTNSLNAADFDELGRAVTISADGGTVVAGAYGSTANRGLAAVYAASTPTTIVVPIGVRNRDL